MPLQAVPLITFVLLIKSLFCGPCVAAAQASTDPRYSYKDAIRETVYIEMGKVAVDIIRPKESDEGLKVPVILEAGPYFRSTKKYDELGKPLVYPGFYDNYFVPRGYAVVLVDVVGTNRSGGCCSIGGSLDIEGVKIVIDWLNQRASAFDKNGTEQKATWTNGKVGMIGGSYNGAMAIGTAATGVEGLVTVVPIRAVSSWYDWIWKNGTRYSLTHMDYLYDYITKGSNYSCYSEKEYIASNEKNAIYENNPFWEERDYLREMSKFKASVFLIHGLHDHNVEMTQPSKFWKKLLENNIPKKLWLAQSGHDDPFNFRRQAFIETLHRWFDFWLMGIDTGIMNEPLVSIERGENTWENYPDWPDSRANYRDFFLAPRAQVKGELITTKPSEGAVETITVADPQQIRWVSEELIDSLRLSGTSKIYLKVKTNQEDLEIGFFLTDSGNNILFESVDKVDETEIIGEGSEHDQNIFSKYVTKWRETEWDQVTFLLCHIGHMLAINENNPLVPDEWNSIELAMIPTDQVLKKGHRLGIAVIFYGMKEGTKVTLDLSNTKVAIPMVAYPS